MASKAQLKFNIIGEKRHFRPFETIAGHLEWTGGRSSRSIEIKLLWSIVQDDDDYEIIDSIEINPDQDTGLKSFSFKLPQSPYSCRGELVSIQWQLEAAMGNSVETYDFVLSADGRIIELASIDDPSLNKMQRWTKKLQQQFKK